MLSKIRGVCSPEIFQALLRIFDGAWAEISAAADFTPEQAEEQRTRLAQLVMAQMEREDIAETDKVRDEVIQMFRTGTANPAS